MATSYVALSWQLYLEPDRSLFYSAFAQYIHRLSDHKTFSLRLPSHPAEIAYVDWSPTSHSIAYVYKNNLYVVPAKDLDALETVGQVPEAIQVTKDGSDTIFNGVPDWVYEEEVR